MIGDEAVALVVSALAPTAQPEVLRAGDAVIVRAPGVGVVRVQPLALGSLDEVSRAATTAGLLADAGAPVARPIGAPIVAGEASLVVWEDAPDGGRRAPDVYVRMGVCLRRLHASGAALLATGVVDLPRWDPLGWLEARLAGGGDGVPSGLADALRVRARSLVEPWPSGTTILHTDAHARNFRIPRRGPALLVDLEGLARGPAIYDLVPMEVVERRLGGDPARWREAVSAYGHDPDDPVIHRLAALRETLSVAWVAGQTARDPAAAAVAAARLADLEADRPGAWKAR